MSTTPQRILDWIQEAKAKKRKTLYLYYLSGQKLTQIPEEVFKLDHLEELVLRNQAITIIPDEIKQLKQLKILDLRGNPLKQITDVNSLILDFEVYQRLKTQLRAEQISGLTVRLYNGHDLPPDLFELSNLTRLDLSNNQLSSLPKSITRLKKLTKLYLYANRLSSLPESITRLKKLTTLDLGQNQLSRLPGSIIGLQQLTELNLRDNQLSHLPESITRLQNLTEINLRNNKLSLVSIKKVSNLLKLETLDLEGNRLSSLPESITRLQHLTVLNLGGNRFSSLPESIAYLQQLIRIDLSGNKLSSVPESMTRLQQLTVLFLDSNQLSSLPESITRLEQLTLLDLSDNQLSHLPEWITRLPHLKTLRLNGNPLESPPIEVAEQGIEKIREYFRQLEEEGVDHLYEAKLLIVGEGGAGKTTLAKKIENKDYVLRKDEATTEGIDVITWHFPLKDGENGREFRVNIWDFGGQEIYHATHQFFLTKRSLYALVADTRKENTDFYYWLNAVELLADDSPLLIVKNEKQDRQREINDQQLRGEFDNLKGTFATNLATNRGLDEILKAIQYYIRDLPHVGSRLPKTWVKVRDALERDERHYITLDHYLALCDTHGFKRHEDKLQLGGYLHDLGVCLHFQDDPVLKHRVIIKPEWATDAVYRVLDNQTVMNKQGKFSKKELATIWHEPKYATMHDELLQLMLKFQLCYRIEHTDWYIAPQLLSLKQPTYQWDEHDNLLLRYQYTFMPKGILTRFIVAMHHYIWQQRYVWRSGVILQDKQTNSKAEVIEHYGKREINVRVVGQQKKELMRLVRHELERIHRSFKRLKYQTLVPCNCEQCAGKQDPHFYQFNTLLHFRNLGQDQIQCLKNPIAMVGVRSLIDDVERTMAAERRKEGDIGRDQINIEVHGGQVNFNKNDHSEIVQEIIQGNPVPSPPEEKGEANKLFFFYLALTVLGFLGNIFTVFDLTACQKLWSRLALTILALICGLLVLLWNKPRRSTRVRIGELVLVILITFGFGWLTYQSYQANAANNCFDVGLNALRMVFS